MPGELSLMLGVITGALGQAGGDEDGLGEEVGATPGLGRGMLRLTPGQPPGPEHQTRPHPGHAHLHLGAPLAVAQVELNEAGNKWTTFFS